MMKKITMVAFALLLTLSAALPVTAAGTAETRLRTALSGGPIGGVVPSGTAEFRSRAGRSSLNVQVEHVNLVGQTLTVYVDGVSAGTILVSAPPVLGGELDLDSQDGDLVPVVVKGSIVTVKNAGGTAILAGVF